MASDDRVFISYSRADFDFVLKLAQDLKAAGANVWLDKLELLPGTWWDQEIEDALTSCPRVLVILSPRSAGSKNVMNEVSFALKDEKTVIPVIYQDCRIPLQLHRLQYVDFRQDYDSALQDLLLLFAPVQRANQSKPSLREPANRKQGHAFEVDQHEGGDEQTRPRKESSALAEPARADREWRGASRTEKEISSGAPSQSTDGFCLPWRCNGQASIKIQNAAVLLTNINSLGSAEISRLAQQCRDAAKTLVVVAPTLEGSAAKVVRLHGGLVIEARDLDDQPMDELLEDLAVYLGGMAMLREVGFGIPIRPGREHTWDKVGCPFLETGEIKVKDELGSALEVSSAANTVCFKAQSGSPDVRSVIKGLQYRASHCARSQQEFNGLSERLRRFGAVRPIQKSLVEQLTFAHNLDEVTLPVGFASRYFISNADRYESRIEKTKILVTTCPLYDCDDILPTLQQVAYQTSESLAVFAPRIHEEALATMVTNRLRGIVVCLAVEVEDYEQLSAIARLTRAHLVHDTNADQLLGDSVGSLLGNAREVVAEFHKTTIRK